MTRMAAVCNQQYGANCFAANITKCVQFALVSVDTSEDDLRHHFEHVALTAGQMVAISRRRIGRRHHVLTDMAIVRPKGIGAGLTLAAFWLTSKRRRSGFDRHYLRDRRRRNAFWCRRLRLWFDGWFDAYVEIRAV